VPELYKRGDVFWATCYTWTGTERKRVQRSTGIRDDGSAQTRRTAARIAADIEGSLAASSGRLARKDSLQQAYAALLRKKRIGNRSEATIGIVLEKAKHPLEYFGPDRVAGTISQEDFDKFVASARAVRAAATVHRECREFVQAVKAVGGPDLKMPDLGRISRPKERWLDAAETERLMTALRPDRRDHFIAYRHMGLRKSELGRIEKHDVSFELNHVRVRGTKSEGADRVIPMTPQVREVMERRCKLYAEGPLFPEPWLPGNADRELRRAALRAGIGPVSFNDLRRSFATELARNGTPSLHLAKLLGHSTTRMVEMVYARVKTGSHMHEAIASLAHIASSDRSICVTETPDATDSSDENLHNS